MAAATPPSRRTPGSCRRRRVRPSRRSRRRRRIRASWACRSSITSSASVTTAPSTQPPDTEPRKLPWSSITRLEPTGRGAEPQVSTTVASATPSPGFAPVLGRFQDVLVARQRFHGPSPSSSPRRLGGPLSDESFILDGLPDQVGNHRILMPPCSAKPWGRSCHVPTAPAPGRPWTSDCGSGRNSSTCGSIARMPLALASKPANRNSGLSQISRRHGAVQPVDLEGEPVVRVALEPVGDQQHDGALRQHPARPELVERGERGRRCACRPTSRRR